MKLFTLFFCSFILTMLSACYQGDDLPDCWGGPDYEYINAGTGLLREQNNFWICDSARTIEFTFNGNDLVIYETPSSFKSVMYGIDNEKVEENGCVTKDISYRVSSNAEEKRSSATAIPVYFIESRVKNFEGADKNTDSNSLGQFQEVLVLRINGQKFTLPIEASNLGDCKLNLTQKIGNKTYDSVYHCTSFNEDLKQDGEVFYKLGEGVLGFRFIANELWLRK